MITNMIKGITDAFSHLTVQEQGFFGALAIWVTVGAIVFAVAGIVELRDRYSK